ncbi:hypothetical protein [Deinococcus sp.]|uniref:hypothetical protein n=1 Tax=Deinococcus sp. TaxID=47478 RepID=UPI003B58E477
MTPLLRYIITRTCLSEGSLTISKHLQGLFPAELAGQTLHLSDEEHREYAVVVDKSGRRLRGLGPLYRDHHLDVNDVLMLSPVSEGYYQVACVVKPHTERLNIPSSDKIAQPSRRVVINATPHVREVRHEPTAGGALHTASHVTEVRSEVGVQPDVQPQVTKVEVGRHAAPRRQPLLIEPVRDDPEHPAASAESVAAPEPRREPPRPGVSVRPEPAAPVATEPLPSPELTQTVAEQLGELARLTGYQLEELGGDLVRLRADLGRHGYDVVLALTAAATRQPAFTEGTYRALLTWEKDAAPPATPRLTREALGALLEHARLAPLTPIDLRGYWNTASFDLGSVASLAELVSAHLVQRGTFTYVLGTLAQQPAHSVVDTQRLAERLGSGVNRAELHSILETLCRAPFAALMPLPGEQYYLRADIPTLLAELSDYAQGVAKRMHAPVRA